MENWSNLSKLISLERESFQKKFLEEQKMIEFVTEGNKKEVQKLLKTGVSPNCFEETLTPLIACVENNFYELGEYLLRAGASISYRPKDNDALWAALKGKSYKFLELFVKNRCILLLQAQTNETPLIYATKTSDVKAVEILLSHFAIKVNERDGSGNTALHYNVAKHSMTPEDLEIGKLLIAAGADINGVNLDGKKPEDLTEDYAAKTMIMAGKLTEEIEKKKEQEKADLGNEKNSQPIKKRLKI